MSAQALLQKIKGAPAKKARESAKVELDGNRLVLIPSFDRPVKLIVAARYWRILDSRAKALEAQLGLVKEVLRAQAAEGMGKEWARGVYVGGAKVGPVVVSKANKYRVTPVGRDELINVIGGTEYAVSFRESARIDFDNIAHLRQHLAACDLAGVEVCGKVVEEVRPKPCLQEKIVELSGVLDQERLAVLAACAEDQAMAVGRAK